MNLGRCWILFLIYVSLSRRLASLSLFPRTIVVTAVILKPFIWNLCSRHITLNEASFNTIRRQLSNLRYLWNAHLVGGGAGDGWITPHTFYQPVVPNIINTFQSILNWTWIWIIRITIDRFVLHPSTYLSIYLSTFVPVFNLPLHLSIHLPYLYLHVCPPNYYWSIHLSYSYLPICLYIRIYLSDKPTFLFALNVQRFFLLERSEQNGPPDLKWGLTQRPLHFSNLETGQKRERERERNEKEWRDGKRKVTASKNSRLDIRNISIW